MLRIISINLNGIRSAWRKGFLPWALTQNADVLCLQELKALAGDLTDEMKNPDGYQTYYHHAERKGYSGVGLWCRRQPVKVSRELGCPEFDTEGRYLRVDFDNLTVISLYQPSGSSSPERQAAKFRFMNFFLWPSVRTGKKRSRHGDLRGLEHCASGNRPRKLARQSAELRLSARRTCLDQPSA